MANATRVKGTTVTVEDNLSAAQAIAGTKNIDFPGQTADAWDSTSLADDFKTYIAGKPDEGEFTFSIVQDLDDVGQAALLDSWKTCSVREYVVVRPAGTLTTATFNGVVTNMAESGPDGEGYMQDVTVKITGEKVYT